MFLLLLGVIMPVRHYIGTKISMYVCMVITYGKGNDHPAKVANPARGQPNREK